MYPRPFSEMFKDLPFTGPFATALVSPDGQHKRLVFFCGEQVCEYAAAKRFPTNKSRLVAAPAAIAASALYGDLPAPFSAKVDAAFEVDGVPVMYLFCGDSVLRYDAWPDHNTKNRVEAMPCTIATSPVFNELPAPFNMKVDAAVSFNVSSPDGRRVNKRTVILFSGDQTITYAAVTEYDGSKVLSAPCAIAASPLLGQLPPPFNTKIDAAVCVENTYRSVVFFSGNQAIRYSVHPYKEGNRILAGPVPVHPVAAAPTSVAAATATVHPT